MKKRVGNDIKIAWTILRGEVAEDFSDATNIVITSYIPNSCDTITCEYTRLLNVFSVVIPSSDLTIGTYDLKITYNKPDTAIEGDLATWTLDYKAAFQMVKNTELEDEEGSSISSIIGTDIVQTTGQNTSKVMSQKAVTDALDLKQDDLDFVAETNNKFLRDDNTFQSIDVAVGGYANNLYFTEVDSLIAGYKKLNYTPDASQVVKSNAISASSGTVLVNKYLFDSAVAVDLFPAGLWSFVFYGKISNANGVTEIGVEYFRYTALGAEVSLFTLWSGDINNTTDDFIRFEIINPSFVIEATDRMGAKIYVRTTSTAARTITYSIGDGYGAWLNNPNKIRHTQLRALNEDLNYQHVTNTEKGQIQHSNRTALDVVTGSNTGDETQLTIKTKIGAATALADGYLTKEDFSTFNGKQAALGFTPENIANKAQNNGYCDLDGGGKVPLSRLPSPLLVYKSVWNPITNTPELLATDVNKKGWVYTITGVTSEGFTQFGILWKLGDWLIYNDSGIAEKSDNSDDVTSVAGKTGAVTLVKADITDATTWDTAYSHSQLTTGNPHAVTAAQVGALGVTAKAADSELLDGYNSSVFGGYVSGVENIFAIGGQNLYTFFNSAAYPTNSPTGSDNWVQGIQFPVAINTDYRQLIVSNLSDLYYGNENNTNWTWRKIWDNGNSNLTSVNWSAAKLTSTTLVLPTSATLASGEVGLYTTESGFVGEVPSGAGTLTSISMTVPTGLSVTGSPITESGTFAISYSAGYQMMTTAESLKLAGIAVNANNYSLPTATDAVLGGVKIGSNITITDGVISVATPYSLPTATDSVLGGVKIGSGVTITDGVISVHNAVTLGENTNGLSLSTQVLSLGLADTDSSGALSSTDWNTFNGKEPAFNKNTAFNKNFGTTAGTVLEGRTFGTAAAAATTDFLATNGKAADSDLLDGHDTAYFATSASLGVLTTNYLPYWNGSALADSSVRINSGKIGINRTATNSALSISGGNSYSYAALDINVENPTTYNWASRSVCAMTSGQVIDHLFGIENSTNNLGYIGFSYAGSGSTNNAIRFGFYDNDDLVKIFGTGNVAIGFTTNQAAKLAVNGNVSMTENVNANLRIPKVAPTNATENQYYFYIVE